MATNRSGPAFDFHRLTKTSTRIKSRLRSDEELTANGDLSSLLFRPAAATAAASSSTSTQSPPMHYVVRPKERVLPALQILDKASLPLSVRVKAEKAQVGVSMGLLSEISCVWIVIDSEITLWRYDAAGGGAGDALTSYQPSDQLIVSVGLVKNLKGTNFGYTLVVCTLIEVIALKIDTKTFRIDATGIKASTDGVPVRCVRGTSDGKCFLGGNDGSLREFVIEPSSFVRQALGVKRVKVQDAVTQSVVPRLVSSWLPEFVKQVASKLSTHAFSPIVSITLDETRKLIYTCNKANELNLYTYDDAGSTCLVVDRAAVGKLALEFVESSASRYLAHRRASGGSAAANSFDVHGVHRHDLSDFAIVSVHAVYSSHEIHLVVVSSRGIRVYLSTTKATSFADPSPIAGKALRVSCIRGPPQKDKLSEAKLSSSNQFVRIPSGATTSNPVSKASSSRQGDVTLFAFASEAADSTTPPELRESFTALTVDLSQTVLVKGDPAREEELESSSLWWNYQGSTSGPHREIVESVHNSLQETNLIIEGRVWDIADEDADAHSDMIAQHTAVRRRVLVLSSQALYVLVKNRPINELHHLLSSSTSNAALVDDFFQRFGLDESCAMMLALACNPVQDDPVSERAAIYLSRKCYLSLAPNAVLPLFAGQWRDIRTRNRVNQQQQQQQQQHQQQQQQQTKLPTALMPPPADALVPSVTALRGISLMPNTALSLGNNAASASATNAAAVPTEADLLPSGAYTGLLIRLTRLLKPIWGASVFLPSGTFRYVREELVAFRDPLLALKEFMTTQAPYRDLVVLREQRASQRTVTTPKTVECELILEAFDLLNQAIQALELLILLVASSGLASLSGLTPEETGWLRTINFGEFIVSADGRSLARSLIRNTLSSPAFREDTAAVAELTALLGARASDFFNDGDALMAVARRDLMSLSNTASINISKAGMIVELVEQSWSTSSFHNAYAVSTAYDRVQETCSELAHAGFHALGIKLALGLARKIALCDKSAPITALPATSSAPGPMTLLLQDAPSASNANAASSNGAINAASGALTPVVVLHWRRQAYDLALEHLDLALRVLSDPALALEFDEAVDAEKRAALVESEHAMEESVRVDDALWHWALYSWLSTSSSPLIRGKLMEMDSKYIEPFLKDPSAAPSEGRHLDAHLDTYARWLSMRVARKSEAREVWRRLALLDVLEDAPIASEQDLKRVQEQNPALHQRLDYFARAADVVSATQGPDTLTKEFELAALQLKVLRSIELASEELRVELNYRLIDVSRLYNEFAFPANDFEACLAIIHFVGHADGGEMTQVVHELYESLLAPNVSNWNEAELAATIVRLGREYYREEEDESAAAFSIFPVDHLIDTLESASRARVLALSVRGRLPAANVEWADWLARALRAAGVPSHVLFVAYAKHAERVARFKKGDDVALRWACAGLVHAAKGWLDDMHASAFSTESRLVDQRRRAKFERYLRLEIPGLVMGGGAIDALKRAQAALGQRPGGSAEERRETQALEHELRRLADKFELRLGGT